METALLVARCCVFLCVCLCGIVLIVSGVPIGRKITLSPRWMMKTKYLAYPHKRLSKPWLNKVHEELWMEIPSGDGPQEEWSLDVPRAETSSPEAEYQTRSPVPEDFSSEVFPTVIDTETEELESYDDELISRFSMTYEGPSSLLNTFIFLPSIYQELPSSHMQTPSLESFSSIAPDEFDLSASWPGRSDREEFEMKVKRTVTSLKDFSVITATFSSHIHKEKSGIFTTQTLEMSSGVMASIKSLLLSNGLITETPLNIKILSTQSLSIMNENMYPSHTAIVNSIANPSQSLDIQNMYQSSITIDFTSPELLSTKIVGSANVMLKSFDSVSETRFLKYESLDDPSTIYSKTISEIPMTLNNSDSSVFRSESFYQPSSFVFYYVSTSTFQTLAFSEMDTPLKTLKHSGTDSHFGSENELFETVFVASSRTLGIPLVSVTIDPSMTENEVEVVILTPPTKMHLISSFSASPISAEMDFPLDTNQISYKISVISLWDINTAIINRSTNDIKTLIHVSSKEGFDLSTDEHINEIDAPFSKTEMQPEIILLTKASSKLLFSKEITRTVDAMLSVQPELLISSSFSSLDVPSHLQPTVTLNSTTNDLHEKIRVSTTMSRQRIRSPQDFSTPVLLSHEVKSHISNEAEHSDMFIHHVTARSLSDKHIDSEGTPITEQGSSSLSDKSLEYTASEYNVFSNENEYLRNGKYTPLDTTESIDPKVLKTDVQSSSILPETDILSQMSPLIPPHSLLQPPVSQTSHSLLSDYEALHLSSLHTDSQMGHETKPVPFPSPLSSSNGFRSYSDPHLTVDIFHDKSDTATFQEMKNDYHSPVNSSVKYTMDNVFITATPKVGAQTIHFTNIHTTQVVMPSEENLISSLQHELVSPIIQPHIEISSLPASRVFPSYIPISSETVGLQASSLTVLIDNKNISYFEKSNMQAQPSPINTSLHPSLTYHLVETSFLNKGTSSLFGINHIFNSSDKNDSIFLESKIKTPLKSIVNISEFEYMSLTVVSENLVSDSLKQSLYDINITHSKIPEKVISIKGAPEDVNVVSTLSSTKEIDHKYTSETFQTPIRSSFSEDQLSIALKSSVDELQSSLQKTFTEFDEKMLTTLPTQRLPFDSEVKHVTVAFPQPALSTQNIIPTQTSMKRKDPESIDSDIPRPKHSTSSLSSSTFMRIKEPHSIDSDETKLKPKTTSIKSTSFANTLTYYVPHSIKSNLVFQSQRVTSSAILKDARTDFIHTEWLTTPLKIDPFLKSTLQWRLTSSIKIQPTQTKLIYSHVMTSTSHASKTFFPTYTASRQPHSDEKVTRTDSEDKLISTRLNERESNDLEEEKVMASVMAVSSDFGFNQSRNGNFSEGTLSNDFTVSTETYFPFPTMDTMLFKDNHYWVLTVLEAPVQGHLPENLSHSLEIRLANAYEEAFRRVSRRNRTTAEDKVVVKVLSVTNDLLLKQLEVIYVVERGGILMPATLLSNYLNFLRFEELRQFLGHHVILKAQPYRPSRESKSTESNLPVLAIVCGILAFLLFSFCCLCIYCRCCRPKVPSTPMSSASASLQRSLEKYGQHNRKHLFREMSHQLTHEMTPHLKQEDPYLPQKPPSGRSLPTLPREEKALKILKIIEGRDGSSSPLPQKPSKSPRKYLTVDDPPKKRQQKPRKRRKPKQEVKTVSEEQTSELLPVVPPKKFPGKHDKKEDSAESSTSWKPNSSTPPFASSGKSSEEPTSDGSNTELLPPIEDLLDKKKAESSAAEAETQVQLSRVRQRIAELLDDAFAMAGGRRGTGSIRNKRVDPATNVFPRSGNMRSQSAAAADYMEKYESDSDGRRPQSEGDQRIFGALTDEGQLITRPLPKLVWEEGELPPMSVDRPLGELTEAHNHQCIHFFSFHHPHQRTSFIRPPQAQETTSSRELIPETQTPFFLNQPTPELQLALSPGIHPAAIDQYDEIDVVGSLRDGGENVAVLLRAIKDELQRFGSLPGESHA